MTKTLALRLLVAVTFGATAIAARQPDQAAPPPAAAAVAPEPPADRCSALAARSEGSLRVLSARTQPAGVAVAEAGTAANAAAGLPSFCRVVARLRPEAGSDIAIEVWLPSEGWDGRLEGVGNGGFAGSIDYRQLAAAVRAGQAVVATDTGHTGTAMTSAWAKGRPELVRDYGWRAIHLAAVAAKRMVLGFYARQPDRSYFVSCSNGGRQGLMEASRFPDDYDGIVAGAPAAIWTDLAVADIWTVQALSGPGAIRPEQLRLLQERVLADCDGSDGQKDGLVSDPRRCRVDTTRLACGSADPALCFSPAQIAALRRVYGGARDASGRPVAPAFGPSGGEAGAGNWDMYITGTKTRASLANPVASAFLQDLPSSPVGDVATFDFTTGPARIRSALAADLDVNPDLSGFFNRGGKLILYHGWADAAIPPAATLSYRDAIIRASGRRAAGSTVLFMMPGMQHCFGGAGPNSFGQLGAPPKGASPERNVAATIQAWVERDRTPDRIVAQIATTPEEMMGGPASGPRRERLICAVPRRAILRRGEDPDRASSYDCAGGT